MPNIQLVAGDAWPAIRFIDSPDLGAPFDAFPVEAEFRVRPDLAKLTPVDDWLRVDREWAPMVRAKLAALASQENIMLASPPDASAVPGRLAAVRRAAEKLAGTASGKRLGLSSVGPVVHFAAAGYEWELLEHDAKLTATRPDAEAVVQALKNRTGAAAGAGASDKGGRDVGDGASLLLGALAMSLQEDLVLMEQGADGIVRAVMFHVSFPSAWNPAEKLGQDLLALHAPVADNALLQGAAARLGTAMVAKGPFVRWVWTVTPDARWRAWPPHSSPQDAATRPATRPTAPADSGPLQFRIERQTTMPLGEGYGLFLIRVQLRPLDEVLATPGRLELLQASLRSMSDAMVHYKNLASVRARLLQVNER
jgi:hypothetical protein